MKELILMYAPTVMVAVTTVVGFVKTAAQLRNNVKDITKSAELTSLKNEIKGLREQISCVSIRMNELKNEIMENNLKNVREKSDDKENDSVSEEV